jgi:hypothetical protein
MKGVDDVLAFAVILTPVIFPDTPKIHSALAYASSLGDVLKMSVLLECRTDFEMFCRSPSVKVLK